MTGYKTYVVGIGMIVYGAIGTMLGYLDANAGTMIIMNGCAVMGLRHGVSKGNVQLGMQILQNVTPNKPEAKK